MPGRRPAPAPKRSARPHRQYRLGRVQDRLRADRLLLRRQVRRRRLEQGAGRRTSLRRRHRQLRLSGRRLDHRRMGQDVLAYKRQATSAANQAILAATAADIPLGRNPTEDDVVNAIMFFLAEESSFLTGVALDVDGGLLSTSTLPGFADGQ